MNVEEISRELFNGKVYVLARVLDVEDTFVQKEYKSGKLISCAFRTKNKLNSVNGHYARFIAPDKYEWFDMGRPIGKPSGDETNDIPEIPIMNIDEADEVTSEQADEFALTPEYINQLKALATIQEEQSQNDEWGAENEALPF